MKYAAAVDDARRRATLTRSDHGVLRDAFGGWQVFRLPELRFRSGSELRCEVVHPDEPRTYTHDGQTYYEGEAS